LSKLLHVGDGHGRRFQEAPTRGPSAPVRRRYTLVDRLSHNRRHRNSTFPCERLEAGVTLIVNENLQTMLRHAQGLVLTTNGSG